MYGLEQKLQPLLLLSPLKPILLPLLLLRGGTADSVDNIRAAAAAATALLPIDSRDTDNC